MNILERSTEDSRILLIHPERSSTAICFSWSRNDGLSCNSLMAIDDDFRIQSLEDIAAKIDAGDEVTIVSTTFPSLLAYHVFIDRQELDGFSWEQIEAVAGFMTDVVGPEGIEIIRSFGMNGGNRNYLDQLNYISRGDAEARRQAIWAYPLHYENFVKGFAIDVIDARRPLAPVIASSLSLSEKEMKTFSQIEMRLGKMLHKGNVEILPIYAEFSRVSQKDVARVSRLIDADRLPSDDENLMALLRFVREAKTLESTSLISRKPFDRIMSRVSPNDWVQQASLLSGRVKVTEARDYLNTVTSSVRNALLVDAMRASPDINLGRIAGIAERLWSKEEISTDEGILINAFSKSLQDNFIYLRGFKGIYSQSVIRGEICNHASLKTIDEMQERWHHVQQTLANDVMSTSEPVAWPALVDDVALTGGVVARELNGSVQLEEQGRRERHCVGGYVSTVLGARADSATLIFSLEKEDAILSTLELRLSREMIGKKSIRTVFSIAQHKAMKNADPSNRAKSAAAELVEHLSALPEGQIRSYLRSIRADPTSARETLGQVLTQMKGNLTNPDLPEIALATFDPVLPKPLRGMTAATWRDRLAMTKEGQDFLSELDMKIEKIAEAMRNLHREAALQPAL